MEDGAYGTVTNPAQHCRMLTKRRFRSAGGKDANPSTGAQTGACNQGLSNGPQRKNLGVKRLL
jgi:hypothetical protein